MNLPTTPGSRLRAPGRQQPGGEATEQTVLDHPAVISTTPGMYGRSDRKGSGPAPTRQLLRVLAVPLVSTAVYFAARPAAGSDAAALAIAGVPPAAYSVAAAVARRRVEAWAVITAAGFAVGCVVSLFAGGSSLPLKLHEATVTFLLGTALLIASLIRLPFPVGRLLKVPHADQAVDTLLSVMVGSFLILHALLHLSLVLSLSTSTYLIAGRVISWATLGAGAACLYAYLRRLRRAQAERHSGSNTSPTSPPKVP